MAPFLVILVMFLAFPNHPNVQVMGENGVVESAGDGNCPACPPPDTAAFDKVLAKTEEVRRSKRSAFRRGAVTRCM